MKLNLPDKLYYSIGEISEALGVNSSLLRFWEKEFEVLKPLKNNKGDRKYTKKDVQVIEDIHYYVKERGFTIKGAKEQLKSQKKSIAKHESILKELNSIKKELESILKTISS